MNLEIPILIDDPEPLWMRNLEVNPLPQKEFCLKSLAKEHKFLVILESDGGESRNPLMT